MTGARADIGLCIVPYDSAQLDVRMGAGPRHLIAAGLHDRLSALGHSATVREIHPPHDVLRAEIGTAFALNRRLASAVAELRARDQFPVVLAGNCNSAVGTIAGVDVDDIGVLWFDAHGDFNTPESTTGGFLDGMALAMLTGRCWTRMTKGVTGFAPVREENVILVGGRDLDAPEAELLSRSAVTHLGHDVVASRLGACVDALSRRVRAVYVHVDLDVLDATEGRANAYAGGPGLSLTGLLDAIDVAASRLPLAAAALTAYDPSCDDDGAIARAAVTVAERVCSLARRA